MTYIARNHDRHCTRHASVCRVAAALPTVSSSEGATRGGCWFRTEESKRIQSSYFRPKMPFLRRL